MEAQQHIEPRGLGSTLAFPGIQPPQISSEHLTEQTTGLVGHHKTNVLVSEIKKQYRLNMLKSVIDKEAHIARSGTTQAVAVQASKSMVKPPSDDKTNTVS